MAKVQFLGLQLELLEDFRIRLVQVMKDAAPAPTAHTHTAVLNAIHYIVQVLKEWSEMVVSMHTHTRIQIHTFVPVWDFVPVHEEYHFMNSLHCSLI